MKGITAILIVALCLVVCAHATRRVPTARSGKMFTQFVQQYNKQYASEEEYNKRLQIFSDNVARINELNAKQKTARYSINKFSDLSREEFNKMYKGYKRPTNRIQNVPTFQGPKNFVAPAAFDWRSKGAVTPVKDQGQCGSCWAFSTTEGVESAWILAGHPRAILSPQQIVDCDTEDGGCNGGDLPTAFAYVMDNGLESEADYPYVADDQSCAYNSADVVARIKNWAYATQDNDESQMQAASMQHGPLSICVDASNWSSYSGGVVTSDCGRDLDHCVQAVGWNTTTDGTPYWIIRNSWGTDWGVDGFIYVEIGKDLCGVSDEATYVLV